MQRGNHDTAYVLYQLLADRGFEMAQSNAAHLLDQQLVGMFDVNGSDARAFVLWKQSAEQGHAVARVKLGDYHYYGRGTAVNHVAAAHEYQRAVELRSPQAMFNLGAMHQTGLGLPQDLHLAKRYYDMAAEASPDARIPASIALAALGLQAALQDWLADDTTGYYQTLLNRAAEYVAAPPRISWADLTWVNVDHFIQARPPRCPRRSRAADIRGRADDGAGGPAGAALPGAPAAVVAWLRVAIA